MKLGLHTTFKSRLHFIAICALICFQVLAQEHPNLILTRTGVKNIQNQLGTIPLFDKTLAKVKAEVDAEIKTGIQVPIPKDMAGGYTHDRHKKNWAILQKSGILYQLLQDTKYAKYVHDVLKEYAKIYPTLPLHPQKRSYARGKIFWQCLNDANWLVYVSQAYDCIYEYLDKEERTYLEKNLFVPYANFLSKETPQFFNRIHNHSTWGNVAVGMIGLVMDNEDFIDSALYGIKTQESNYSLKDNDGGNIIKKGQKAGFFANLDSPFSPDGYYTEGPYYQRYAMYPFMIFAQALQTKKPELKIFQYKDSVLIKSVDAILNLTDQEGDFFPINDAQKGMSYYSKELVSAVNIAYHYGGKNPTLLDIAQKQNSVQLDETGLSVSVDIKENKLKPFLKKSIELRDGANGNEGGISIIRSQDQQQELVMKYTAHGLSHGHYDKLSFSYYNKGKEVLQDYGLARFVNIEQKNGGGYLKENKTWAKQTIAHNTIVQDEKSHFNGNYDTGSAHHSEKYFLDISNTKLQVISAKENNAYPDTKLHRTMVLLEDQEFEKPLLVDVVQFVSDSTHQFDLPYYYQGQIIDTNFEYVVPSQLSQLGKKNGYQHLWLEGKASMQDSKTIQATWLANGVFYTLSALTDSKNEILFTRIGANDPNFNLRRDPAFIIRKPKSKNDMFITLIETHGSYDPITEVAKNAATNIKEIKKIKIDNEDYMGWVIITKKGNEHSFILCTSNSDKETQHAINLNTNQVKWVGPYYYIKNQ